MMIVASVSITTATRTFLAVARSATKSLSDWVAFLILPVSPFSLSLSLPVKPDNNILPQGMHPTIHPYRPETRFAAMDRYSQAASRFEAMVLPYPRVGQA
jgi:hypothetical protein